SSTRRIRWPCSLISSAISSAAMMVSRMSPISPKSSRNRAMRRSRSRARPARCSSCPSSHAIRYCRPLMLTLTCPTRVPATKALSLGWLDDRTNARDRGIEPRRDLPVGRLQRAAPRRRDVELGGEPRPVRIEGVHLGGERRLALVALEPAADRSVERIERGLQAPGRGFDRACLGHAPPRRATGARPGWSRPYQKPLAWQDVTNRTLRG